MSTNRWLGGQPGSGAQQNDASLAANWSTAAVPVAGDDVYIEANPSGTDWAITAGLSTLSAVTLNSLNISQTFSKTIGTSSAYFVVSATTLNIGYNFGNTGSVSGPSLVKINLGSVQSAITVFNSASASSSPIPGIGPISLLGTHASNTLTILGGTVTIADTPGETSTLATINNSGNLYLGSGVTLTTVTNVNGYMLIRSAATSATCTNGQLETEGTGAITTVTVNGGTATLNSTGTITTLNMYGGTSDFSTNSNPRTVTTANGYGGVLNINNGVKGSITFTNPVHTFGTSFRVTTCPGTSFAYS